MGSIILLTLSGIISCGTDSQRGTDTLRNSRIVFESDRDGNYEIYVMNADGSNPVQLTDNDAWDGMPSWSPF